MELNLKNKKNKNKIQIRHKSFNLGKNKMISINNYLSNIPYNNFLTKYKKSDKNLDNEDSNTPKHYNLKTANFSIKKNTNNNKIKNKNVNNILIDIHDSINQINKLNAKIKDLISNRKYNNRKKYNY